MTVEVRDNPEASRYEVWAGGELAGFTQYRLHDDRVTFIHTEIDPAHEGEGLGSRLARSALDDMRARGLMIAPQCPFIAGYIRRHRDEYLDAVLPTWRDRVGGTAAERR
jgi:predicted GNAT family acetyltransferase